MAPECLNGKYSFKIDVYSFSILLFMLVSENFRPYGTQTTFNIEVRVFSDPTFRPVIEEKSFEGFEWLIEWIRRGWAHDPDERWDFNQFLSFLKSKDEEVHKVKSVVVAEDNLSEKYQILIKANERLRDEIEKIKSKQTSPQLSEI